MVDGTKNSDFNLWMQSAMNWLFKGNFDNFFLKVIFDFTDYMISVYLNKDGKTAEKTKMTDF